jgi:hypothetical protein
MASMEDTDENIVSEILLQLPVLIAESESRRYCVRVKWGNRKRRSTRFPNPEKTEASGSQKNPKRKRDSGNAEDDSDKTKAINLCLKERKHDNHVAPFMMLVFLNFESLLLTVSILVMQVHPIFNTRVYSL